MLRSLGSGSEICPVATLLKGENLFDFYRVLFYSFNSAHLLSTHVMEE